MRKTIITLLTAAFVATLLVPTLAVSKPVKKGMKNCSMSKKTCKAKHVQKAWPASKSNKLGLKNPQKAWPANKSNKLKLKHPQKTKIGDRCEPKRVRGEGACTYKAGKSHNESFGAPHKTPPAHGKNK